jgi:hypothetical protein
MVMPAVPLIPAQGYRAGGRQASLASGRRLTRDDPHGRAGFLAVDPSASWAALGGEADGEPEKVGAGADRFLGTAHRLGDLGHELTGCNPLAQLRLRFRGPGNTMIPLP